MGRDAFLVDFWKCAILNIGGVVNGFKVIGVFEEISQDQTEKRFAENRTSH